ENASKLLLEGEADFVAAALAVADGVDAIAVADEQVHAPDGAEAEAGADAEDVAPVGWFGRDGFDDCPVAVEVEGDGMPVSELLAEFEVGYAEVVGVKLAGVIAMDGDR